MKRYGLPVLLSAIYVTAMFFVFSSDYSKENTFLYPDVTQEMDSSPSSEGPILVDQPSETPNRIELSSPSEGEDSEKELPSQPERHSPEHHSPEASEGD